MGKTHPQHTQWNGCRILGWFWGSFSPEFLGPHQVHLRAGLDVWGQHSCLPLSSQRWAKIKKMEKHWDARRQFSSLALPCPFPQATQEMRSGLCQHVAVRGSQVPLLLCVIRTAFCNGGHLRKNGNSTSYLGRPDAGTTGQAAEGTEVRTRILVRAVSFFPAASFWRACLGYMVKRPSASLPIPPPDG